MTETSQSSDPAVKIRNLIDKWLPATVENAGPTQRLTATLGRVIDNVVQRTYPKTGLELLLAIGGASASVLELAAGRLNNAGFVAALTLYALSQRIYQRRE